MPLGEKLLPPTYGNLTVVRDVLSIRVDDV